MADKQGSTDNFASMRKLAAAIKELEGVYIAFRGAGVVFDEPEPQPELLNAIIEAAVSASPAVVIGSGVSGSGFTIKCGIRIVKTVPAVFAVMERSDSRIRRDRVGVELTPTGWERDIVINGSVSESAWLSGLGINGLNGRLKVGISREEMLATLSFMARKLRGAF